MATYLERILALDPERDHLEILRLSTCYEFPFDTKRSLEFALFRTYAVPTISRLLDETGEFRLRPQKRYDDTAIIISLLYADGYDSERGRAALRNMNRQHGQYPISNDDLLYVLTTFVYETPRWIDRFGWRATTRQEKLALFYFWRELGRRMNIKNIPEDYETLERFNLEYERQHFQYTESNRRVGDYTVNLMLGWFLPRVLWPLGAPFVYAMLDENLYRAFGFPTPPGWLKPTLEFLLRLRARATRLLGPRTRPYIVADEPSRTYPRGYSIEQLGPPSS